VKTRSPTWPLTASETPLLVFLHSFPTLAGGANTAVGAAALANNTANDNTACGSYALASNTTGSGNTAFGIDALMLNINGNSNHASGHDALFNNTSGSNNTANGANSLFSNTTGLGNTANGYLALNSNDNGNFNVGSGAYALFKNTSGSNNTGDGSGALQNNTTGLHNTANGYAALYHNTTGSSNTALGSSAGSNLTTGSNNIDIASPGVADESNTIRIGAGLQTKTFIAGIRGRTTGNANAIPVLIDSAGELGTASSSRRFKNEIKPMDKTSEAILALKPVTFHYKSDRTGTPQFGLIAEEVAAVNADLVVRDEDGQIYTVRYDAVNAMLLNEFLKEHRKVEEQEATITQLKSTVSRQAAIAAQQQKQIEALTAGLQQVSSQLELSKPVQTLATNQ
jgi:uncharacterized coiled-coil protein SlyX